MEDAVMLKRENFTKVRRVVRWWLMIGLVMVFFQVFVGGVTRLTDSGLSITEWAVIQGTLPPMNEADWNIAFEKYKVGAKRQYESLHGDMVMSEFKVIFFWEYFHRLWARLMGFVFIIPFFFFLYKKWMPAWLLKRLGVVILLASAAATFGWIMVASGLNEDNRTWVSAYKLMTHLGIATILFGYLFWTWLRTHQTDHFVEGKKNLQRFAWMTTVVLGIQILLGGLMAGMRAGLIHPYFPFFIEGERFLEALSSSGVGMDNLVNYEQAIAPKAWVQVFHRSTAYLLAVLIILLVIKIKKSVINSKKLNKATVLLITLLITQFCLGILTLVNCFGKVPVAYASLHQVVALLLLINILYICYQFRNPLTKKNNVSKL